MTLTRLIEFLIAPPAASILLILLGLATAIRFRKSGSAVVLAGILYLYLASTPRIVIPLIENLEYEFPALSTDSHGASAIVVLGGGRYREAPEYAGDTITRYTLERVRYAAKLHEWSGLPILVSGGSVVESDIQPEANLMREVLSREFKVSVRWAEDASTDTYENAFNATQILKREGIGKVLLVTQAWHMPRSVWCFQRAGLEVVPAPTGFTRNTALMTGVFGFFPQADALKSFKIYVHESLGLLWYRMRYSKDR